MTRHPGLPAHRDHCLDGGQLHARGPGLQEGRVEAGVRAGVLAEVRKLGLGVKQEDSPSALHSFQSLFDLLFELRSRIHLESSPSLNYLVFAHSRKLVHAGMDEETFESRYSETDHLSQVRRVVWNHSSPEFDIDATLALCSLNFDPGDDLSDES